MVCPGDRGQEVGVSRSEMADEGMVMKKVSETGAKVILSFVGDKEFVLDTILDKETVKLIAGFEKSLASCP